jgi:hypothetical protein
MPFSEWGTVLPDPDPGLVAAIVDRVTFNARIVETVPHRPDARTKRVHPDRCIQLPS